MSYIDTVPEKFYKQTIAPQADTVGELINLLSELPSDLPINQGYGAGGTAIVVFNIKHEAHLEFLEIDEI